MLFMTRTTRVSPLLEKPSTFIITPATYRFANFREFVDIYHTYHDGDVEFDSPHTKDLFYQSLFVHLCAHATTLVGDYESAMNNAQTEKIRTYFRTRRNRLVKQLNALSQPTNRPDLVQVCREVLSLTEQ